MIGGGVANPAAPFFRSRLSNGTTAIVKVNKRLPVVAMDCWVKTGTVNESTQYNGISHFYEHMFFKGTERHPAGELDRLVKEVGGYNNAATSNEYTHYYVVLPGTLNEHALLLLADALNNCLFNQDDIERERMVVKEEINRAGDDPASKLYTTLFEECFEATPYALPVLGKKESLDRITAGAIADYHSSYYVPENVTVVISGDVDPDHTFDAVEKIFGGYDERAGGGWQEIDIQKMGARKETVIEKDVKQVYLALGFVTGGFIADRKAVVALDVAASILGEGRSSRLHQELVEEKKLAISIGAWNWDMRSAGIFWIDAILRPDKIEEVEQAIFDALGRFLEQGASTWEMKKVMSTIKADQLYDLQTNESIAGLLGFYETDLDDAKEALSYLNMIEDVRVADLRREFSNIFDTERFVKTLIVPSGE